MAGEQEATGLLASQQTAIWGSPVGVPQKYSDLVLRREEENRVQSSFQFRCLLHLTLKTRGSVTPHAGQQEAQTLDRKT